MIRKPVDYEEAVAYVGQIPMFVPERTREHTDLFLERLGFPACDRKVVHVAGTNGKGSVCAYIQAILESEGKKTGFFTSPHLISVNERIQINREPIDNACFYQVFSKVYDVVRAMNTEGIPIPHFSEFLLGMALLAFEQEEVEYIVLETGLGGTKDATNAFPNPTISVITSISLDHTQYLGNTIEEIAAEKAGIIKKGVPVFFDGSVEKASAVIRKIAGKCQAPWKEISKNAFEIREVTRKYIAFSRANAYDKDVIWKVPICGIYQVMNAEIAIQAVQYLLDLHTGNSVGLLGMPGKKQEDVLRAEQCRRERLWAKAVEQVSWQGRMEECADHFIVDGAHNPGAVEAFVESVRALHDPIPPVIIFSAVSDKKYDKMIHDLCTQLKAKAYVVTRVDGDRAVPAEVLGEIFEKYTKAPVFVCENIKDAIVRAYEQRAKEGYIYCLGSLYLVAGVKKLMIENDMTKL